MMRSLLLAYIGLLLQPDKLTLESIQLLLGQHQLKCSDNEPYPPIFWPNMALART